MPTILAALVVFASVENENQLVPEEGLEPSRGLTPPDFESGASAIPPLRHGLKEELILITNSPSVFKGQERGSKFEVRRSGVFRNCGEFDFEPLNV